MFSFRIELNSCANISAAAPGGALQLEQRKVRLSKSKKVNNYSIYDFVLVHRIVMVVT